MLSRTAFVFVVGLALCGAQIVFPGEEGKKDTGGRAPVPRPVGPSADQPAEPPINPSEDPSADSVQDPANPQTRIFGLFGNGLFGGGGGGGFGGGGFGNGGGLFGGIGNIFNPCSRCNFNDIKFAHTCCQRGERQCCQYTGDFGFNSGFGGSGFGSGFGGSGFGHGAVGPGFGGGFDGIKPGFKPVGPPGFIPSTGGLSNIKPGFCPKPHIFEGLFGTRSADEEKENGGDKISFRSADEPHEPSADSKVRQRRQAPEGVVSEDPQGSTLNADPQTRFFPGLTKLPNIFCRDECFTDFDCPGPLKCCINFKNCRDCAQPRFF